MLLPKMTRDDMVKIANASLATMTEEMEWFLSKLIEYGKYAEPSEIEFYLFDKLLDEMEEELF
tara:strand:+ start:503 stop:691 length:189 start_codon:yes stop_codon:yes gene_type:complete